MFEFFAQFFKQATTVFNKLDAKQKVVILIVSSLTIIVIVWLMAWTGERQWAVLNTNLQPEDASAIIAYLDEEGISYKLETEGTAILVPQGTELELRLEIQSQGLVTGGVVGYEIFDRPSLGMTDFLQKVNYKRSLEGELSKTIQSMDMVEMARVLIVMPEASLFVEDKKDATASVILTLEPGQELSSEQINNIGKVIAFSVEGLRAANVNISDSYGNNLSKIINRDPLLQLRSEQLRLQRETEIQFKMKLDDLLTKALGPQNYDVKVTVEYDFTQATSTSTSYEPMATTPVRSEESENSTGAAADTTMGTGASNERTVSNYELNQTIRNEIEEYGRISRISAAVMVTGDYQDVNDPTTYVATPQAELDALEASVKSAIGFIEGRDEVSVVDFAFDITTTTVEEGRIRARERELMIQNILKWVMVAAAGFAFIFVLRSVFRSLDLLLPKPKPKPAIDIEAEAIEEEISAEAQRRAQMLDQVSKFTREKPSNVASLLTTWLIEEKA